ncbi:MAG: hypothetical protein RH917_06105 [Lacipirellulaceae bacterium]
MPLRRTSSYCCHESEFYRFSWLLALILMLGCSQSQQDSDTAAITSPEDSVIKEAPAISEAIVPETESLDKVAETSSKEVPREGRSGSAEVTPTPHIRKAAKPVTSSYSAAVPPVLLSETHRQQCLVDVGDKFPELELPTMERDTIELSSKYGETATVVLIWTPDRWMSRAALADIQRDVTGQERVRVISIALGPAADSEASDELLQLQDEEGLSISKVGSGLLPRIYVLDRKGVIAWFDVEYSEATRRELNRTLAVLETLP